MDESLARAAKRLASMGGKARTAKMTPEQRKESARKAAKARWARRKQPASSVPPASPEQSQQQSETSA